MNRPRSKSVQPSRTFKTANRPVPVGNESRESFGLLIRDLHRYFSRTLQMQIEDRGITTAQWFFLRVLWDEEGLSQVDLSNRVGLTTATTVVALNTLEKKNLIERQPDPADRRKFVVRLTAQGRRMESPLRPCGKRVNDLASAGISPAVLEKTRKVLRMMRTNLDRNMSD